MPILIDSPSTSNGATQPRPARIRGLQGRMRVGWVTGGLLVGLTAMLLGGGGCGSGGYPGGGIEALSASAVTIDSGQSWTFTAREEGSPLVSWSLTCAVPACGSLSATTGMSVVYTAPAGLTAQMGAKLTAAVSGTTSSSTAAITVNPDPTLALVTATATVGAAYTSTTNPMGGTAPLTLSLSAGTLPPGLSFDTTTGAVTGTPTTTGTFNFSAQIVDSSALPYTATEPETIVVAAAPIIAVTVTGNPPGGTVQSAYTTTFSATGGTPPYAFSLLSGSLPPGLTLLSSGVLSGTPTTAGTSTFTIQAQDSVGTKGTAAFSITIAGIAPTLTLMSPPVGTVGVIYSGTIGVGGGSSPYSCVITGTLPAGLTSNNCTISGTPGTAGTTVLTVTATDSSNPQGKITGPVNLVINPAPLSLTLSSLPNGTINVPYSQTIGVTGGTAPYSCVITGGTLQAGLSLSGCTVSGTPTVASTVNLTVKATDSSTTQESTIGPVSLTILPAALSLTLSSLPDGTINVPYSQTIGVSGGTAPYSCTITAGTLQAGLTLSGCTVSGTPTVASTVNLTVKATDSSPTQETTTGPVSLTINPAALKLTLSSLPDGTINVPYSQTIGVSGGTAPYSCTITAGTLQAGLTLSGCTVSGTPTVASTVNLTVKATDASNPQESTTGPVSLTINPAPLKLTLSSLPDGTVNVPYSQTIGVSGGTAPYSCTIVSGTLQQGLSLTGCTVSGTPTVASTVNLMVKATDSSPTQETTTGPVSLTINPAALSLTLSSLPDGTINKPYSAVIGVAGGTAPYTCTITAGTLQAGLTLTGCTVSGTPTVASTVNLTVKATDSSNPQESTTGPVSLTINPAALTLTLSSLPDGTVGTPYSATIGVSGGTAPYSCMITAGTLQAGLTLTGCTVSGTPTVAGTANLTVKATDSSPTQETTTGPVSLTINPAAPVIVITSPPAGTVNVPYSGPIGITGGTGPYTCTLASGTLPAGLTLTGCTITGTPTAPGSTTVTVTATDSSNPPAKTTGPITIVINPATATLTLSSPPAATVDTPYTGAIGVSGGTGPYTCVLNSGTVPPGLTLTNCTLTGTPTTAGATVLNITATDSSTPTHATTTGNVTVTVNPLAPLTLNGSLPNATVGVFYTQTITAQGGLPPYTYAITAGALPQGITLDPTTGVFSGTPTAADVGATSFTETVTDSEGPKQTASLPLVLLVVYPPTANDSELDGPYAYLFQGYDDVVLGVLAYQTATAGSFTADGMGGISLGELDANHQSSDPAGNTVSSQNFLGTYTIGADQRGSLTLTVLNADGTTGHTTTYAIAVKAPVAPTTITTEGSLIESDDDQAVGTKGSGTLLAQTATAFTAGLNGSYAFGVSGDTPCLPSCTIGIIAGPVATVGQFTTDSAGAITSGTSDTNIATTNIPNSDLGGTYTGADANGRLQLSLSTGGAGDAYPTDYAVYVVDANRAFLVSTDKHSAYILLAGSAQLQTQSSFTDASMSAPFIGYENSQTNPGLVGATLQNVLNFSTATIFRGTGVSGQTGECDITNVDTGGVTGLLNGLTGIVGNLTGVASILGSADYTGDTTCQTTSNGRGVLQYPSGGVLGLLFPPPAARVYYLSSPETGYFLETSYAGLGKFEAQTGAPFSEANTFAGTYVYGMAPASSLASTDSSGILVSNGAGEATTTLDENVGVGTINVIELGQTSTQPYTAPNSTTGRFTLGPTDVIYAITPNRFVLLDTNPTTTSPSVAVLY
jgi:hypothetical protein